MRIMPVICTLALTSIWMMGCSCSDDEGTPAAAGGAGAGGGGTGGMATGGAGAGGMGGTPAGGAGAGGMGGTPAGGAGAGGTGGVPVVPPYCGGDAGEPFISLPFDVSDHTANINPIGPAGMEDDFAIIANPNCDEVYVPTDAGASDAGDAGDAGSSTVADASVMPDAGSSDAGSSDAGDAGDGGGASAGCDAFHYVPTGPYAGVIYQFTATQNGEGVCVAEGATSITFEARADRETSIKFGFVRGPAVGDTEDWFALDTAWREYTIEMPANEDYNNSGDPGGVWNLFSVVGVPVGNTEPTTTDADTDDPINPEFPTSGEAKIFVRNMVWH